MFVGVSVVALLFCAWFSVGWLLGCSTSHGTRTAHFMCCRWLAFAGSQSVSVFIPPSLVWLCEECLWCFVVRVLVFAVVLVLVFVEFEC